MNATPSKQCVVEEKAWKPTTNFLQRIRAEEFVCTDFLFF